MATELKVLLYPAVDRGLSAGVHPYVRLIPGVEESPALARIFRTGEEKQRVLPKATVHIRNERGFAWVDDQVPCIVLAESYYIEGHDRDLYLDMLHELTHLRQIAEGRDVWDDRFEYVDRPTEIEGYAVAVEEGRRLGMTDDEVVQHLSNPWMSEEDVLRLVRNVEAFLGSARR